MNRREPPGLTDYLLIGLNPGLIMVMVGSLGFFLLEAFYQGQYDARLKFIFAMFIMGAVSTSRISIEQGKGYAAAFAFPLAIVVAIAMGRFITYTGSLAGFSTLLNWSLIALIWFAADKLTWDCTVIDESQDASGEGLLQAMGLDRTRPDPKSATSPGANPRVGEEPDSGESANGAATRTAPANLLQGLWTRWVNRRQRAHTPGVWVVYFSLAALPLFGIGQWFIPSDNAASLSTATKLLGVYLASGLTLLASTSFLNLRRYLRQRRAEMPAEMAVAWLGSGLALILVLLLVASLLPRPGAGGWMGRFVVSPLDLQPSKWGVGNDGPRTAHGPNGQHGQAEKHGADGGDGTHGQRQQGRKSLDSPSREAQGQQGRGQQGQTSLDSPSRKAQGQGKQTGSSRAVNFEQGRGAQDRPREPTSSESPPRSEPQPSSQPPTETQSQSSIRPLETLGNLASGMGRLLQVAFFLAIAAVVAYFAWKHRHQFGQWWRQLVAEWRAFWAKLFGRPDPGAVEAVAPAPPPPPPPPRFADFSNPFQSGLAQKLSPSELVRYTFQAFEAWARERGAARSDDQTPLEFAQGYALVDAVVGRDARTVAEWYSRSLYAPGELPSSCLQHVRQLWDRLTG